MAKNESTFDFGFAIFFICMMIFTAFYWYQVGKSNYQPDNDELILSNSTAHDLCYSLTNNSAVLASADEGKLVCETPSYDHVSNIIIRSNAQGDDD